MKKINTQSSKIADSLSEYRDKMRDKMQRQKPKIIERDVIVYTLVDKYIGNCGGDKYNTSMYQTMQYDPCKRIPKGKQVGNIYEDGKFATKDDLLARNVYFFPNEYSRKKPTHKKNKQYLMYGLIAVVGYFAYKKFK